MSEINQKLGFDVSQALDAIKQLDSSLAGLQNRFQSMGGSFGSFNSSGSAANAAAAKLGTALRTDVAQGAATAQQATERLTVSIGLLSRITFTQAVVRALSTLRNELRSTLDQSLEFTKRISEIQTIAPNQTIDELGKQVRQLSDDFNLPLLDVAKSKYDLISNGFSNAADQQQILSAAFRFGKTAIAGADESVNLLSTTLNAFGLNASNAEQVAAHLFKTVEIGRIVGSELASNLGKTAPLANQLGVSLDEVAASFAQLTIKGVSASEAATQIAAALTSLLKPSPAAVNAMHLLGFETGEALIKAKGFIGGWNALISTTDGSSASIAKLAPNVRALKDVLSLATDEGLSKYQATLTTIANYSPSAWQKVFDKRISTDAERVTSDLNKLSNAMTIGFGNAVVKAAAEFSRFVGGVGNAVSVIDASGTAFVGMGVTLAALVFKFGAAKLGVDSLAGALRGLNGLLLVPLAQGVGSSIGTLLDNKLNENRSASLKKLEADNQAAVDKLSNEGADKATIQLQQLANLRSEVGNIIAESDQRVGARLSVPNGDALRTNFDTFVKEFATASQQLNLTDEDVNKLLADLGKLNTQVQGAGINARIAFGPEIAQFAIGLEKLKDLQSKAATFGPKTIAASTVAESSLASSEAAKKANDDLVKNDHDTLERILQARQKYANDLRRLAQTSSQDVIKDHQHANDLFQQLDDQRFNFANRRFSQLQQSQRDRNRAESLSADAARLLRGAQSPEQIELANRQFQRAGTFAQSAAAAAQQSGNRTAQLQAEREIETVLRRQAEATRQQATLKAQIASQASRAAAAEQARVDDIARTSKHFLDNLKEYDAKGNKLPTAQLAANRAAAQKDLDHLNSVLFSPSSKFDISTVLGFDKLQQRLQQAVTGTRIDNFEASSQALSGIGSQIQGYLDSQHFSVNVAANVAATGSDAQHEAYGGLIREHFATGGQARGTDTVLAMLSPGEFVMNAASTRKFYSELVAMNADRPIYRAEGGPVSNVHVGGITINASPNPQQTAREVMNLIRREQRRGTALI
jgi:TP901 family phage tail tape measure protein